MVSSLRSRTEPWRPYRAARPIPQESSAEREVGAGLSDDTDLVSREIGDLTDLRGRLLFEVFACSSGRRPYYDVVLAQYGERLRVSRNRKVAASDRQVGFASAHEGQGFGRSWGGEGGKPDGPAAHHDSESGGGHSMSEQYDPRRRRWPGSAPQFLLPGSGVLCSCGRASKRRSREPFRNFVSSGPTTK